MMGGGGGVVPPVLLDEARVPRFYRDAIAACGATQQNMLPHTALVYNLMVTSGLPRPVLSYIWSAVNRTLPGQLTRPEFFSCLALIALAQKGESLAALSTMSSLPIPFLQSVQVPVAPSLAAPVVNVLSTFGNFYQRQTSSFIPTSLLMGKRSNAKKKDMDLIGEALPPTTKLPGKDEAGSVLPSMSGELGDVLERTFVAVDRLHTVYCRCLNHLYFVVCRVERSAKSELPKGCREEIDYCTRIWKRLVSFIENPEEEDRDGAVGKPCAICCQPVSRAVHFGGQTYHSECANLWVNDVNSLLPNMHLVS
ncbi:unnamed protein product [Haemonchus placei]|uniref:EH domain-containing protein n=1 Tax=Haemonchus placei TaxID=6290 RepID=A0A0N4X754_HAEPC|nr:unnamed protein product [Haemonchus placei]